MYPYIAVTGEQMSKIDIRAQEEYMIPSIVLMENAGKAVAEAVMREPGVGKSTRICILCGKGNNGGDGFVACRYLMYKGYEAVNLYITSPDKVKKGAAAVNLEILRRSGARITYASELDITPSTFLGSYDVFVDAIFGTGFRGELPAELVRIGEFLETTAKKVFAVDIPTGLDPDSGKASRGCIKAYRTVTFGLHKKGFFEEDGPGRCGDIILADIGFPPELLKEYAGGDFSYREDNDISRGRTEDA
jgi:NAD(P)H-hydrate epimerase